MTAVAHYLQQVRSRQMVRPWALCAPIVVLVIALPLLRPLRSPGEVSEGELARLATIQSLVEYDSQNINATPFFGSLRELPTADEEQPGRSVLRAPRTIGSDIPGTIRIANKHYYSDQPPVMAYLLSWPYALMYHALGWDFQHNPALVAYLLTLLGVTLPVAGAAGLIYRMGRMFELKRPYRTGLALAVVLGSGLISYATVLNPHAPAAALVLSACACLFHVTVARKPARTGAWLMTCGLAASTAAVIDVSAAPFLLLLGLVVLAYRWKWTMRVGGVLLFLIGATPPILLHAVLTVPVTGDLRPGFMHADLGAVRPTPPVATDVSTSSTVVTEDGDDPPRPAAWKVTAYRLLDRSLSALFGGKGLLTHWPVVIFGVFGLALVLRRHWPASTKVMAGVTLAVALLTIAATIALRVDWTQSMFGPRWFVVFLPLTLFWAGAWLRKPHKVTTWAVAAVLLAFSVAVSVVGATAPFVRAPGGQYTVTAAVRKLVGVEVTAATPGRPGEALANR